MRAGCGHALFVRGVVGLGNAPGGVVTDIAQGEFVQPDGVCTRVRDQGQRGDTQRGERRVSLLAQPAGEG